MVPSKTSERARPSPSRRSTHANVQESAAIDRPREAVQARARSTLLQLVESLIDRGSRQTRRLCNRRDPTGPELLSFHRRPDATCSLVEDVTQEAILFSDRFSGAGIHARPIFTLGPFVQVIYGRTVSEGLRTAKPSRRSRACRCRARKHSCGIRSACSLAFRGHARRPPANAGRA